MLPRSTSERHSRTITFAIGRTSLSEGRIRPTLRMCCDSSTLHHRKRSVRVPAAESHAFRSCSVSRRKTIAPVAVGSLCLHRLVLSSSISTTLVSRKSSARKSGLSINRSINFRLLRMRALARSLCRNRSGVSGCASNDRKVRLSLAIHSRHARSLSKNSRSCWLPLAVLAVSASTRPSGEDLGSAG